MTHLIVTPWAGPFEWLEELERQARVMRPSQPHYRRFREKARQLQPWRIRSSVQCNSTAIGLLAPVLRTCRQDPGRKLIDDRAPLFTLAPWSDAELGELLVELNNRVVLLRLGRDRPRDKGPRFDLQRLPDHRIDALIQRHFDMAIVEALRAERSRRLGA